MRQFKPLTFFALFMILSVSLFSAATPTYAGEQGCTPGYWKVQQHHDSWPVAYQPTTPLNSVFQGTGALGSDTLLTALNYKGGSTLDGAKQILLRAGVAALLNAQLELESKQKLINYPAPYIPTKIITDVNRQLTSGTRSSILALATKLDNMNNLGCPLN